LLTGRGRLEKAHWYRCLQPYIAAAASSPSTFLGGRNKPLIIDEVQMVPEIFRPMKIIVDELRLRKKANGRYLLTGSANIMALPKLSDALVGRMAVLTLYPLSALEIFEGKGYFIVKLFANSFIPGKPKQQFTNLLQAMRLSTFPEISEKSDKEREIWFGGYLTTILQRDVRMVAEIEKATLLPKLLRVVAARAGNLVNEADIARAMGLNAVTSKRYRNILKLMYLVFDVEPWFRNIGKRLNKSPKTYVVDTALLCHPLQYRLEDILMRDPLLFGHILENFTAAELSKQLAGSGLRASLFHFRSNDNKEVDFVLERPNGQLAGIKVKAA